jgi:hypothetical protein
MAFYFFDVVAPIFGLKLDEKELDKIEKSIISIARTRFPR